MTLAELITALEAEQLSKVVPHGFAKPHSYRGDYAELAFEPAANTTVASMLAAARGALGATFHGYKGGEYVMGEHTDCWLAEYGRLGETIGPLLLKLMLAEEAGRDDAQSARDAAVRHALDQLDAALCETNGADLGGTSDDVLAEVDRRANSVRTQIARVRRSREGARQEAGRG